MGAGATYPAGRSAYKPGRGRVGDPSPQTDPDLFSTEDLRAEIRYLTTLDRRYGSHHLRAMARLRLAAEIGKRAR